MKKFSSRTLPSNLPPNFFSFALLAIFLLGAAVLTLTSCEKDTSPNLPATNTTPKQVEDRETGPYGYTYYLDDVLLPNGNYPEGKDLYYDVSFESPSAAKIYAYTTQEKLNLHGDLIGDPSIRKMSAFASRMSFLADSAGLSESLVEAPTWYTSQEQTLFTTLFPPENNSIFGVTFFDFWNSNVPLVFNLGPSGTKPVMFYPAAFPYAWGNRVSSIKPECFTGSRVTLWDKTFYRGSRATYATPIGTPPTGVPANGRYHLTGGPMDNKASSCAWLCF